MYQKEYDVVIIGGGPAGSMAGRAAASAGAKTLIIDKKKDIGSPVHCGGVVATMSSYEQRLGIKFDPRCIEQEISKVVLYSPSGKLTPELPVDCTIVQRPLFDKHLAREAGRSGAEVMVNTRVLNLLKERDFVKGVTIQNEGKTIEIRSKVVIGADGFVSNVARWSGLARPRFPLPAIEYEFVNVKEMDPSVIEFFFGTEFCPGGYAFILPKGKDIAYVGLGFRHDQLREKLSMREMFRRFLNHPQVKKKLEKATPTALINGTGWMGGPVEKTVSNGVILAGDAAGQVWACNGGGVPPSMTCGHFAGGIAAKAIREGDVSEVRFMEYEDTWRRTMGKSLFAHVEAVKMIGKIIKSDELIERAVDDVGQELVGAFMYALGYLEPLQEWLDKTTK